LNDKIEEFRVEMKFNVFDQNDYNLELRKLKTKINEMVTSKARDRKAFMDKMNLIKTENDRVLKERE